MKPHTFDIQRLTCVTGAVGLFLLLGACFVNRSALFERYYLWRLESPEETTRRRAAETLAAMGAHTAVPRLFEILEVLSVAEGGNDRLPPRASTGKESDRPVLWSLPLQVWREVWDDLVFRERLQEAKPESRNFLIFRESDYFPGRSIHADSPATRRASALFREKLQTFFRVKPRAAPYLRALERIAASGESAARSFRKYTGDDRWIVQLVSYALLHEQMEGRPLSPWELRGIVLHGSLPQREVDL